MFLSKLFICVLEKNCCFFLDCFLKNLYLNAYRCEGDGIINPHFNLFAKKRHIYHMALHKLFLCYEPNFFVNYCDFFFKFKKKIIFWIVSGSEMQRIILRAYRKFYFIFEFIFSLSETFEMWLGVFLFVGKILLV